MSVQDQRSLFSGPDAVAFRKRGYVIVRDLFEADEVERLRSTVIETFAELQQHGRVGMDPGREGTIRGLDGDLLSIAQLRHVLLDSRILRVIGELLGGQPVYFGDSSVRVGSNGVRGWHRDNVNRARRRGPDWQDSYRLLRCGLYLQDHSRHSGGLALRPHSHETKRLLPTLPTLAPSKAGDLIAWNMRTVHSGEAVRIRRLPGIPLSPRAQSRLPNRLRVPEDRERIVLFMAFGVSGFHLDNYVRYLRTRHYMQKSWSHSRFARAVWDEAETAGLQLLRPIPAYGAPPDPPRLGPQSHAEHHEPPSAKSPSSPHREAVRDGDRGDGRGRHGKSSRNVMRRAARLVVVYRADRTRNYRWLPPARLGDIVVTLDTAACFDLADRHPFLLDELESWDERSAVAHRVNDLLTAIGEHPAVTAIAHTSYRLIDFAEPQLRLALVQLLRGWTLARAAADARDLACDPLMPPALIMGVRARLGHDPKLTPYELAPASPGSRLRAEVTREMMRGIAAISHPEDVRVAAVATDKLSLALTALSTGELHAAGVGVLPFPGWDHGAGALVALRRRLPLLTGYGPRRPGPGVTVQLPERLNLCDEPELDGALTALVEKLLACVAPVQDQAVRALGGLTRTHSLRAILLPSAARNASRLLIRYARDRSLQVGTLQGEVYGLHESDGDDGDQLVDIVLASGDGAVEQTRDWPDPCPAVVPIGAPGVSKARPRSPADTLRRALIATRQTLDTPMIPVSFCKTFIDVLAPGLVRLKAAGVELELRPDPCEDPAHYRHLLSHHGLDIPVLASGSFEAACARADVVVASAPSTACDAAALGLPILLWLGPAPRRTRRARLIAPWTESTAGTFEGCEDFRSLVEELLDQPAAGFRGAHALAQRLTRYVQPFDAPRFARALRALAE